MSDVNNTRFPNALRARGHRNLHGGAVRASAAIGDVLHTALTRAASTAVHLVACLYAVADDSASATRTRRRKLVDRALEAVESVTTPLSSDLEGLVVIVTADLATRHLNDPQGKTGVSRASRVPG